MAEEDFAEGAGFDDVKKSKDFDDSVSCFSDSLSSVVSSIASGSSMEDIEEGEEVAMGLFKTCLHSSSSSPFKRGLSKHYQGKSQSFTSLGNVLSVEELIKPENPYNKKLKSCRSYACGMSDQNHQSNQGRRSSPPSSFSRIISKKASRGSCFVQMNAKGSSSFRPPMPHRSTSTNSISNQMALFT